MSDFNAIIHNKDLFQVEVEFRPIVDILNYINETLKSFEGRVLSLETLSKTHVTIEEYEDKNKKTDERISSIEERLNSLTKNFTGLSTDVKNLESKINLTIDDRMNSILISTNMNIKHSMNAVDAQLKENENIINGMKKDMDEVNALKKKFNLSPLIENIKKNANDIASLKNKLEEVKTIKRRSSKINIAPDLNSDTESVNSANVSRSGSILNLPETNFSNAESNDPIVKQLEEQKNSILALSDEIKEIKGRLSMTDDGFLDRNDDVVSVNSSFSSASILAPSKPLNNESADNSSNIKSDYEDHKANVINAMKAIQFELQQIRDNGQGLLDLPPLNLYNTVPSFFNEDKQIQSISDNESALPELGENPSEEENQNDEIELKKKNAIEKKNQKYANSILRGKNNSPFKPNKNNENNDNNDAPAEQSVDNPQNANIDIDYIIRKSKNELQLGEIQNSFKQFKKDHDEILNSVERKVDREYVERLFDKFRIIVHSLNDRVKELAALTEDYATKDEFKLIVQLVKSLPKEVKPGTAVKRGPTCLFCGRPKTSIAGEISPRTAAMAGSPPVRNVATKDGGCEFVYGDGQAFRKDENFQSFPHFDILPPLPAAENDDGKSAKKSETVNEVNGKVGLTKNGERAKAASSLANSRSSKSRK